MAGSTSQIQAWQLNITQVLKNSKKTRVQESKGTKQEDYVR